MTMKKVMRIIILIMMKIHLDHRQAAQPFAQQRSHHVRLPPPQLGQGDGYPCELELDGDANDVRHGCHSFVTIVAFLTMTMMSASLLFNLV